MHHVRCVTAMLTAIMAENRANVFLEVREALRTFLNVYVEFQ